MRRDKYPELKVIMDKAIAFKEKQNLTYDELGQALNCTRSHVHRVFTLQTFPSVHFLIHLSRIMGLSLSELSSSDNDEPPTGNEHRVDLIRLLLIEMNLSDKEVNNAMDYINTMLK